MRGFVVSFSSASSVIRRRIRAFESKSGQSLIEPAWLNHNAWILFAARRRSLSSQEEVAGPVQTTLAAG